MKRIASILAQAGAPLRGCRCTLALSLLLSLLAGAAGADIKTLHDNGQVTWGTENEPEVIYLLDGEVCTEADAYDEIVLKFTGTAESGFLTIASGVKVSARGDISIAAVTITDEALLAPAKKDKLERLLLDNANKALKLVKDVAEQRGKEAMKELGMSGMLG